MLYLIIDPYVLTFPKNGTIDRKRLERFIAFLLEWSKVARQNTIKFGITKECLAAIQMEAPMLFSKNFMRELTETHLNNLNHEEFLKATTPFWEEILEGNTLDDTLEKLKAMNGLWEFTDVGASPPQYLNRLEEINPVLESAFENMLSSTVFARLNRVMPLSDLRDVRLLTTLDSDDHLWAEGDVVIIQLHYEMVLEEELDDNTDTEATLQDTIAIITSLSGLEDVPVEEKQFKTVVEAVHAAHQDYPDRIILTDKAIDTARKSGYQKPENIYLALRDLVICWLSAYENNETNLIPDDVYKHETGYDISGEGENVKRDPYLSREREVTYKGETHFAEKHVKLGRGPNSARIYFKVVQEDDINRLLIVRAGIHPPTDRRKT